LLRTAATPSSIHWTKGKIIETFPTKDDNLIRSVLVEVDGIQLYRDINKISIVNGAALYRKKTTGSGYSRELQPPT